MLAGVKADIHNPLRSRLIASWPLSWHFGRSAGSCQDRQVLLPLKKRETALSRLNSLPGVIPAGVTLEETEAEMVENLCSYFLNIPLMAATQPSRPNFPLSKIRS